MLMLILLRAIAHLILIVRPREVFVALHLIGLLLFLVLVSLLIILLLVIIQTALNVYIVIDTVILLLLVELFLLRAMLG